MKLKQKFPISFNVKYTYITHISLIFDHCHYTIIL